VYTQAPEALELKIRLRYPDSERATQSLISPLIETGIAEASNRIEKQTKMEVPK
jgi:hypothetical protein